MKRRNIWLGSEDAQKNADSLANLHLLSRFLTEKLEKEAMPWLQKKLQKLNKKNKKKT